MVRERRSSRTARKVIDAIDSVKWYPAWSRDRIRNMTETRPDWCISRQRAWGVPIPAVRCAECDEVAPMTATMDRVEEIFAREGSDAWYSRPAADFVAPGVKCAKCGGTSFVKEEDILDVWFDSGSSQAAVLGRAPGAEVAGRRVPRSGRAGARMVQLVARSARSRIAARRLSRASSATG